MSNHDITHRNTFWSDSASALLQCSFLLSFSPRYPLSSISHCHPFPVVHEQLTSSSLFLRSGIQDRTFLWVQQVIIWWQLRPFLMSITDLDSKLGIVHKFLRKFVIWQIRRNCDPEVLLWSGIRGIRIVPSWDPSQSFPYRLSVLSVGEARL